MKLPLLPGSHKFEPNHEYPQQLPQILIFEDPTRTFRAALFRFEDCVVIQSLPLTTLIAYKVSALMTLLPPPITLRSIGQLLLIPSCPARICHTDAYDGLSSASCDIDGEKLFKGWMDTHNVKNCLGTKASIEKIA